jgi:hypothetical protein
MPMRGRQLRIEGVRDHNSPDESGPPIVDAWLHYDTVPQRDDLRRVLTEEGRLVASFTQDAMIRAFEPNASATSVPIESRL